MKPIIKTLPTHEATASSYLFYIGSRQWAEKPVLALQRDNFRCRLCNSSDDLEVHHRSYGKALGEESLDDLGLRFAKIVMALSPG